MKAYTRREQLEGEFLFTFHCSMASGRAFTITKCANSQQEAFDKLNGYQRAKTTSHGDRVTQVRTKRPHEVKA